MDCSKCNGLCCKKIYLNVQGTMLTKDMLYYLALHGVAVMGSVLIVPLPCLALVNGRCSKYSSRPQICKAYSCEGDTYAKF